MKNKREVSVLIPYRISERGVLVFLQKRSEHFRVLPGLFSFFGGKLEPGETPEEALKREIREELGIEVKDYFLLLKGSSYFDQEVVFNVYAMPVPEGFENTVTVQEGDYGKFFLESEAMAEEKLIEHDKKIIKELCEHLRKPGQ